MNAINQRRVEYLESTNARTALRQKFGQSLASLSASVAPGNPAKLREYNPEAVALPMLFLLAYEKIVICGRTYKKQHQYRTWGNKVTLRAYEIAKDLYAKECEEAKTKDPKAPKFDAFGSLQSFETQPVEWVERWGKYLASALLQMVKSDEVDLTTISVNTSPEFEDDADYYDSSAKTERVLTLSNNRTAMVSELEDLEDF